MLLKEIGNNITEAKTKNTNGIFTNGNFNQSMASNQIQEFLCLNALYGAHYEANVIENDVRDKTSKT